MTLQSQMKALITGASSGMGRSIAVGLARAGFDCALIGRDQSRLDGTAHDCREAGREAYPIVCDLGKLDAIKSSVREAIDRLGGLSVLVNAAGIHITGKTDEIRLADWDLMLDVNFRAVYHLVHHALDEIKKHPGGAIVNIGAIAMPYVGSGMATGSKRALAGFSEALFEDMREHGVKVCTIRPGWVNTPMASSDGVNRERMIQPEDIVRTVLFVLTMPDTTCPTEIVLRPQRSPYTST